MKTIKIIGRLFMSVIALYLSYLCWYILGTISREDYFSVLLFVVIMAALLTYAIGNTVKCFERK